jgi:hypothetical protein
MCEWRNYTHARELAMVVKGFHVEIFHINAMLLIAANRSLHSVRQPLASSVC